MNIVMQERFLIKVLTCNHQNEEIRCHEGWILSVFWFRQEYAMQHSHQCICGNVLYFITSSCGISGQCWALHHRSNYSFSAYQWNQSSKFLCASRWCKCFSNFTLHERFADLVLCCLAGKTPSPPPKKSTFSFIFWRGGETIQEVFVYILVIALHHKNNLLPLVQQFSQMASYAIDFNVTLIQGNHKDVGRHEEPKWHTSIINGHDEDGQ